ncbi:YeeE/YedE thiosulfate transporter family protein [Paraburkholderia sp. SIMBA_054]|uniref:YeeE/YedE thiosulfate transporter family protein n=1 Tax=Paraburkholderia sp. SIMBA_054 TaxID=3085795 RepID=UPI0039794F1D
MNVAHFLLACTAAGLMGFANQRGETCAVSAIRELVDYQRANKIAALLEASVWSGAGFVILNVVGMITTTPLDYARGLHTVIGGVLFGAGAVVNGACIFGTVARIGSGEWSYLSMPVGFYFGALVAVLLPVPRALGQESVLFSGENWKVALALGFVFVRIFIHKLEIVKRNRSTLEHVWSPHVATTIIAISFLVVFAVAGNWNYTDILADFAHSTKSGFGGGLKLGWRLPLCGALFAGALIGGATAGRLRSSVPAFGLVIRRLTGGVIMGVGASLIPGGNTGLILVGVPLLFPYAWVGLISIFITVYALLRISGRTAHSKVRTQSL